MDRVRTYGLAAAGGIFVVSTVVVALGTRSDGEISPPEAVPRGLVLGLMFAIPALMAIIGVRRRDAVLLAAAGGTSLVPAWLSIATIALVLPALMLFIAGASAVRPDRRRRWLLALAIVALQAGAIFSLLATTETRCWLAYDSPDGLVYRRATEAETQGPMGPGGPVASGCDGGALTERGAALAGVLAIGELAIAFGAPSRRRQVIPRRSTEGAS